MKRILPGFLCLIMVFSCGIPVIPKSITVKGNPGVYLPLGSPFSRLEEGERLEDYINTVRIREMMNSAKDENDGSLNDLRVYDYWPDSNAEDIQTYVIHYPITEMKRDLSAYVREASMANRNETLLVTIPEAINSIPLAYFPIDLTEDLLLNPGSIPNNGDVPLFKVRLPDMAKLVKEVYEGPFGIKVQYSQSFFDNLRVKIPAFDIDYDQQGRLGADGKLEFVNDSKTKFVPMADLLDGQFLEVYVRLLGPCSGPVEFGVIFEWYEAVIDTTHGQGSLWGEYAIENSFRGFLGEGVGLKKMQGFIYVDGLGPNDGKMSLKSGDDTLFPESVDGTADLTEAIRPNFPDSETEPMTIDLLQWAQSLSEPIEMAEALNDAGEVLDLKYRVEINEWILENDPEKTVGTITVDMVLLLPLAFIVTTESTADSDYVKLEMGDAFLNVEDDENEEKGDLLRRDGTNEDLYGNIDTVAVLVKDFRNTIIGSPIFILLESPIDGEDPYRRKIELDLGSREIFVTIQYEELPNPFIPKFEILLLKDPDKDFATLTIKRQVNPPEFDFFLAVEARADLNIKLY